MQALLTLAPPVAHVRLDGQFTYEAHRAFKEATTPALEDAAISQIEIDFALVSYLDSAALGMLLLLNERAGSKTVRLVNAKGTVRSVLEIANFGKIFEIEYTG
ncbi:STAS domain-containing protein [Chitinolyticbacter meiyuanensis]|uniref:STAS domain-containing protein n=1 Tax=Chitinolyticbacter meiyuanensis TaxID=682798 RepID=UPI0011E599E5|nr:STAS domain-containing protein [Chitinolyticbacter meiyuanensis]